MRPGIGIKWFFICGSLCLATPFSSAAALSPLMNRNLSLLPCLPSHSFIHSVAWPASQLRNSPSQESSNNNHRIAQSPPSPHQQHLVSVVTRPRLLLADSLPTNICTMTGGWDRTCLEFNDLLSLVGVGLPHQHLQREMRKDEDGIWHFHCSG